MFKFQISHAQFKRNKMCVSTDDERMNLNESLEIETFMIFFQMLHIKNHHFVIYERKISTKNK